MRVQKGFTLIELMVVIVIIGILSALAIPKMFGVSAKAKAAEAPGVIANWEKLESAFAQEKGQPGLWVDIGFVDPSSQSKWWIYQEGTIAGNQTDLTAIVLSDFGDCKKDDNFKSTFDSQTDNSIHDKSASCGNYAPNF